MPVEFKDTKGLIYCNDCGAKSVVKYHWLGLKCDLEPATSLAALHLNANPAPSHLSVPTSADTGSDRRIVSYNMTHGRAISPVVSNYFGLPTERESEKPSSLPFFGGLPRYDGESEYGALNFLSKKLRDRYGFLAGDKAAAEATSAAAEEEEEEEAEEDDDDDDDDDAALASDSSETDEEDNEEGDDDDGVERIDLFGHR
ncbi:uncharacterized protein N7482_007623 [Penicillium canariense]|uniref:RCHY1 zinc-ribbon domain-containing protein n=1 Tax=Penicillium canariense TaxID=189055 RepID=A0A9W9HX62_9EURO|nr:uncharacterized protein N7482_007623 [Penicillium canariense]KAJ5160619.1 hypothetical protein N7482_007623 [Penicillium canariense]